MIELDKNPYDTAEVRLFDLGGSLIETYLGTSYRIFFDSMGPGSYWAEVENLSANNCLTESDTIEVTEPDELIIADTSTSVYNDYFDVSCFNTSDGWICWSKYISNVF